MQHGNGKRQSEHDVGHAERQLNDERDAQCPRQRSLAHSPDQNATDQQYRDGADAMRHMNGYPRIAGQQPAEIVGADALGNVEAGGEIHRGSHSPWQVGKSGQASAA